MRGGSMNRNMDQLEQSDSGDLVEKLQARIDEHSHQHARRSGWVRRVIPTGLTALDEALPRGGLPNGAIIDILVRDFGAGAMSLAFRIAYQAGWDYTTDDLPHASTVDRTCSPMEQASSTHLHTGRLSLAHATQSNTTDHRLQTRATLSDNKGWEVNDNHPSLKYQPKTGAIVLIDTSHDFYPPALQQHGTLLDRLIVIRPTCQQDAFWAADQSLRCSGVSVVLVSLDDLDDRLSRRLQLAAQSSGCTGVILRPAHHNTKSFAAVQLLVEGVRSELYFQHTAPPCELPTHRPFLASAICEGHTSHDDSYLCRITLLKVLEGMPAGPVIVDLHHETGAWPIHPVPVDRSIAKRA